MKAGSVRIAGDVEPPGKILTRVLTVAILLRPDLRPSSSEMIRKGSLMHSSMEDLTERGDHLRNRTWPDKVKARIVAETLRPDATVAVVACRHEVKANHLKGMRTCHWKPGLPTPSPVSF